MKLLVLMIIYNFFNLLKQCTYTDRKLSKLHVLNLVSTTACGLRCFGGGFMSAKYSITFKTILHILNYFPGTCTRYRLAIGHEKELKNPK